MATTWHVAGMHWDGGNWVLKRGRTLEESEFDRLAKAAAFIRQLSNQDFADRITLAMQRIVLTIESFEASTSDVPNLRGDQVESVARDVLALVEAVTLEEVRLLDALETFDASAELASGLQTHLNHMRSRPEYLTLIYFAELAQNSILSIEMRDGELFVGGKTRNEFTEAATAMLGYVLTFEDKWRYAWRQQFESESAQMLTVDEDWMGGMPRLVSETTRGSALTQTSIADLPIQEIDALRSFYESRGDRPTVEQAARAGIKLGNDTRRTIFEVGETSISHAVANSGSVSTSVEDVPGATLGLDAKLLGSTVLDYWGPLEQLDFRPGEKTHRLFAGAVKSARVDGPRVGLECEGAVNLTEQVSGGTLSAHVSSEELIYSLVRLVGLSEEDLPIAKEPAERTTEEFVAIVPIEGLVVEEAMSLGLADFRSRRSVECELEGLPTDGALANRLRGTFLRHGGYCCVTVTARSLDEAEAAAIELLDVSIAWLAVRSRYGTARLPSGKLNEFQRELALQVPRHSGVILIRGRTSRRCWLRVIDANETPAERTVGPDSPLLEPEYPSNSTVSDRHALIALRRAMTESSMDGQLQALWEAVEFYVSRVKTNSIFSKDERAKLKRDAAEWMNEPQLNRYVASVDSLNSAPTLTRLRRQIDEEGVPISESEEAILFSTLRKARNSRAHGSRSKPPSRAELQRGIGVVTRLLVYRISNRRDAQSASSSRLLPV